MTLKLSQDFKILKMSQESILASILCKWQEIAGTCKTLVKVGSSMCELRDLDDTCKFFLLKNVLASSCKIPQVTLTRSCLEQASCKFLPLAKYTCKNGFLGVIRTKKKCS